MPLHQLDTQNIVVNVNHYLNFWSEISCKISENSFVAIATQNHKSERFAQA